MIPPEADNPAALNFKAIFGNFYRHLFCVLPRSEFEFFHDAFERFVIEDWKGLVRGQHRYFSLPNAPEFPMDAGTGGGKDGTDTGQRILDLVRHGQIEGIF